MKIEFFGEVEEVLTRWVCDISPHDFSLVNAHVADVCNGATRVKFLRRAVEANSGNHFFGVTFRCKFNSLSAV